MQLMSGDALRNLYGDGFYGGHDATLHSPQTEMPGLLTQSFPNLPITRHALNKIHAYASLKALNEYRQAIMQAIAGQ